MTDLDICKRIAEIEGECIEAIHGDVLFISRTEDVFNPIQDKALCFELMVKYKIDVEFTGNGYTRAWQYCHIDGEDTLSKSTQRAICLAIIETNKE